MNRRPFLLVIALGLVSISCDSASTPTQVSTGAATKAELVKYVSSLDGVDRVDSIEIKESTWGVWRITSSENDPEFDQVEQPVPDTTPVTVVGITGHVEPLIGVGATDWGIIVLETSTKRELERYTGRGIIPNLLSRL